MTRISLNIGGVHFETEEATLQTFSRSRLARECCGDKERFYDRNPYVFSFILDSYRYGTLHLPQDICSSYLQKEIKFWEIPVDSVRPCCFKTLYAHDDDIDDIQYISEHFPHLKLGQEDKGMTTVPYKSTFLKVWKFIDDAKSSRPALVYAIVLFCCTMVLIILDALKSANVFRETTISWDSMKAVAQYTGWNVTNPKLSIIAARPNESAMAFYWIASVFLCVDTLLRLVFCPQKTVYLKNIFHIGELIHFIGFILVQSVFWSGALNIENGPAILWVYVGVHAMEGTKVAKLFRLGLNIPSVKLMHISLVSSYRELLFLFMLILTFTSLLGPMAFLAEFTADGNINDMLTSFWWALITMTTVGYGDHYPVTIAGRGIGALCAVLGVIILAMPIGILASSFSSKHLNYQLVEKFCQSKNKRPESAENVGPCTVADT